MAGRRPCRAALAVDQLGGGLSSGLQNCVRGPRWDRPLFDLLQYAHAHEGGRMIEA